MTGDYYDSPALAVFSGNRDYIAWTWAEEHYGHQGENDFRAAQVNDFYAGKTADPLSFLTGHAIQAVVIWPDDKIPDDLIASLKSKLAPAYTYVDCRGHRTEQCRRVSLSALARATRDGSEMKSGRLRACSRPMPRR